MHLILWKGILIAFFSCTIVHCCPQSFFKADADTCLHIANPSMSSMKAYCDGSGSKVFGRPMNKEIADSLYKEMEAEVKNWMPDRTWLGMQAVVENSQNTGSWYYEGEEDKEFSDNDYRWWYRRPQWYEHCALTGANYDYLAEPAQCDDTLSIVCERYQKPCDDRDEPYIDYRGLCLAVYRDAKTYDMATSSCKNGGLMQLKSDDNVESLFLAFHNTRFAGGIYIGLNKTRRGWYYDNGDTEVDGWEQDDSNAFDCGGVRLMRDGKLGLYSIPCYEHKLHFLCEVPSSDKEKKDESSKEDEGKDGSDEGEGSEKDEDGKYKSDII